MAVPSAYSEVLRELCTRALLESSAVGRERRVRWSLVSVANCRAGRLRGRRWSRETARGTTNVRRVARTPPRRPCPIRADLNSGSRGGTFWKRLTDSRGLVRGLMCAGRQNRDNRANRQVRHDATVRHRFRKFCSSPARSTRRGAASGGILRTMERRRTYPVAQVCSPWLAAADVY